MNRKDGYDYVGIDRTTAVRLREWCFNQRPKQLIGAVAAFAINEFISRKESQNGTQKKSQ